MLLSNKTAIITGTGQGIGLSITKKMAEEGANIIACAQAESSELTALIKQTEKDKILPIYFDFENPDAIKLAVKAIKQTDKQIDILVNVAGMTIDATFPMVTQAQLHKVFQINFFSQIAFTQYIVRLMQRHGSGSIINFSSISGLDGNRGQLSYSSAKAAWVAATKTMSKELAPTGIRVNAVAPGVIDTDMIKNTPPEAVNAHTKLSSLGRIGTPEEVADVIAFLASDNAKYITGQILRIDGGIG